MALFTLLAGAPLWAGCSFCFVDGPPPEAPVAPYFDCTTSNGWPVVDTVLAVLEGLGTASIANDPSYQGPMWAASRGATVAAGLGWTALFAVSALVGFSRVSACQQAKSRLVQRLTTPGAAPYSPIPGAAYPTPPPGVSPPPPAAAPEGPPPPPVPQL